MEVKPGYKWTDVGRIPTEWKVLPLRENVSLISGHHILAKRCNTSGHGMPYITGPSDFRGRAIEHTKYTTQPVRMCRPTDILVTVKGSGSGTVILSNGSYCISRQLMAIRTTEWDKRFLYFSLLRTSSLFGGAATGLIPGLSRDDILSIRVAVPDTKAEQAFIGDALSDADALIESLEQLLAKKRQIKQGTMHELLSGKRRLPGFEVKARFKNTEVGPIPFDWDVKPLASLFIFQNGANADRSAYGHGVPFANVLEVINHPVITDAHMPGRVTLRPQAVRAFALRSGDVLFNRTSETQEEVGLSAVYLGSAVAVFGGFVIRGRPRHRDLNSEFMGYMLRSSIVRSQITSQGQGAVRANVGQQDLSRIQVVFPGREEQAAITDVIRAINGELDVLEERLNKARQIKEGMMQELLTGRIRLVDARTADDLLLVQST